MYTKIILLCHLVYLCFGALVWDNIEEIHIQAALSPLLQWSHHCVHVRLLKNNIDGGESEFEHGVMEREQQIVIENAISRTNVALFANVLKNYCKCVIGETSENALNDTTSLSIATSLVRLVPQHVILFQGHQKPSKKDLAMQKRLLIWKQQTKTVIILDLLIILIWHNPTVLGDNIFKVVSKGG